MKNYWYILVLSGLCSCRPADPDRQTALPTPASGAAASLDSLFEEVIVMKMHLFAVQDTTGTTEAYPYTGRQIGEQYAGQLSSELHPGQVYACYRLANNPFYVLRAADGDLMLGRWDANSGQLVKVMDLASRSCDVNQCRQQDAWITDLDDDRSIEIVLQQRTTDAKNPGTVLASTFSVLSHTGDGQFKKSNDQITSLAPSTSYVMKQ